MASQTSGTILHINRLEVLEKYWRLVYELPVAKKVTLLPI